MHIERLGGLGDAPSVLQSVASADESPAALIGDWFGSRAVIAPQVSVTPVDPCEVFTVDAGVPRGDAIGGGWIGYLSYPDAAADGRPSRIPEAAGG